MESFCFSRSFAFASGSPVVRLDSAASCFRLSVSGNRSAEKRRVLAPHPAAIVRVHLLSLLAAAAAPADDEHDDDEAGDFRPLPAIG